MQKVLDILFQLYFFVVSAVVTPFFCLLTISLGLCERVLGLKPRGVLAYYGVLGFAKTFFFLIPWWKVRISGAQHLEGISKPCIIIANHQSITDIFMMFFLNIPMRFLGKDSVFRTPLIGGAAKAAGYIPVKRGDRDSHRQCSVS